MAAELLELVGQLRAGQYVGQRIQAKILELNNNALTSKIMGFVADLEGVKNEIALVEAAAAEYWGREYLDLDDDEKFYAMKKEQFDKMVRAGQQTITNEMQKIHSQIRLSQPL